MLEKRSATFGQVQLLDTNSKDLIELMIKTFITEGALNRFIALHVSYFNNLNNSEYINSLSGAYLYADGASVVIAAKIKGFKRIRRAATTDIAPILISEIQRIYGHRLKIGLIGGDNEFISKVAEYFIENYGIDVVYALNGFPDTWDSECLKVMSKETDLVFIGMGVPTESIFLENNKHKFNSKLILTCGGWFGFLIGGEKRAPEALQKFGLEWVWRMAQSPKRLFPRYLAGVLNFIKFVNRKN